MPILSPALKLAQNGQVPQAIALCRQQGQDAVSLLTNLGALLSQHRHYLSAVQVLNEVVTLPAFPMEAVVTLSGALNELGRFDEACHWCRSVLNGPPVPPQLHSNLGNALSGLNRHAEALEHFRQAALALPGNAAIWMNLGNTAVIAGNGRWAEEAFARAIDITPENGALHRSLAMAHSYADAQDPHFQMMTALHHQAPSWEPLNRMELEFALGKACEDLKDYDRAITHLLAANAIKRAHTPYDEARAMYVMEAMEQTLTAPFLARHGGHGHASALPLFIVGMPRSGTTLVEQIIASLPGVEGLGEIMAWPTSLTQAGPFAPQGPTPQWFNTLGAAYEKALGPLPPGTIRTIDKLPANFTYAGLIHMALPQARIIHLRRNPVDTCMSCFARLFSGDQPFTYDLAELGRYYRRYERLMDHWRQILPAHALLEVQYEDLITKFATEARRIVEFCGLEWNNICLDFHKTDRPVKTASASQVRQPLYRSSMGRYQKYSDRLRPLLDALEIG